MPNKTKRLGFPEVRRVLSHSGTAGRPRSFISDEFSMLGESSFVEGLINFNTPYIIEDVRLVLLVKGRIKVTANLVDYEAEAGSLFVINYGAVLQAREMSDDLVVIGMMISPTLVRTILGDRQLRVMDLSAGVAFVRPGDDEVLLARRMIDNVWDILQAYGFAREVVHPSLRAFMEYVEMLYNRATHADPLSRRGDSHASSSGQSIFNRYVQLVNQHCAEEHNIGFYADKLCISNHYLSSVIKKTSGLTAKQWIDKALITQAKMMLKSTDLQMAQITSRLNFPNPSFFSKYFKHHSGMTPQQYRNNE